MDLCSSHIKDYEEMIDHVPQEYHEFADLFDKENDRGLPQHSKWDHEIPLKPGTEPQFKQIYKLNPEERATLKDYLARMLKKGWIRESTSSAGYPILFVPKKNGKKRLCVDYRQLNDITNKNRYPLPLISALRDRLYGANWFTALDMPDAYNFIRIKVGDEWKTAFRTPEGHFEYLVMPFGLTNAPASFQTMMDQILREYIDDFVVVYLDDILIYSKTLEEHHQHVRLVLAKFREHNLLINPEKSEFHTQKIDFVGYTITPNQVHMQREKTNALRDWKVPTTVTDVRSFLGFTNYYRVFIKGYGQIAKPLNDLTKKDQPFQWGEPQEKAFRDLIAAVLSDPIIHIPDPDAPFELETDASDYAMGAQLGQRDKEGRIHPIAFMSKTFSGPELNYKVYEKELMAIVLAVKEWRSYLVGSPHPIIVHSDHKNLTYFLKGSQLNGRLTRWYEELLQYDLIIKYCKGSENQRADALSRYPHPEEKPENNYPLLKEHPDGTFRIATLTIDTWSKELQQKIVNETLRNSSDFEKEYANDPRYNIERIDKGVIKYRGYRWVPPSLQETVIREIHEHPLHGHQGIFKTQQRARKQFDFSQLKAVVRSVVLKCDLCARSKPARHKPYGELHSIPPPDRAWKTISMDFITKLPSSQDPTTGFVYDSIMVVTDRLTKYALFIPWHETFTAKQTAWVFKREVLSNFGIPEKLITDRDKLFTSHFWMDLMSQLGIKHNMTTAFHPQTDGQTERMNQNVEAYLRCYIDNDQTDWIEHLPTAQYAYNTSDNEDMGVSPFFANKGFNPVEPMALRDAIVPAAYIEARKLVHFQKELQDILIQEQQKHKRNYDRKRLKGPTYKEGDKVYLLRKNIKTKRPSSKLDFKKLGPFLIKRVLGPLNCEFSLPKGMRIHPIFHTNLLEPAHPDAKLQTQVEVEPDREYEVEEILDQRQSGRKQEYLIKWEGYDHSENTWEPTKHLKNCGKALKEWHEKKKGTLPENPVKTPRGRRPQRAVRTMGADRGIPEHRENSNPPPEHPSTERLTLGKTPRSPRPGAQDSQYPGQLAPQCASQGSDAAYGGASSAQETRRHEPEPSPSQTEASLARPLPTPPEPATLAADQDDGQFADQQITRRT